MPQKGDITRLFKFAVVSCTYTNDTLNEVKQGIFETQIINENRYQVLKQVQKENNIYILKLHEIRYKKIKFYMKQADFLNYSYKQEDIK